MVFDAEVVAGWGAASHTIPAQLPKIITLFPEVSGCHPASINLQLKEPLRINNPDFTTPQVNWQIAEQRSVAEKFSFLRVQLEHPLDGVRHKAWLYIAHGSPHRHNLFGVEVIAAYIAGLVPGDRCRLHIPARTHRRIEITVI
jgi:hypothetical protein